ncbi:MAG: Nif3-like dinuclear metal center hexameric protein, partial [Saprospiraceae bacterium]|nr:Nif3-like dinuclear metal center hexameric protein [Saprospiraceae bacterium]
MMDIKDVISYLELIAPRSLQESYDNAGLIIGDPSEKVSGVLITLDSTEEVIQEAIDKKCNLVVAHHPIIFKGLKKINGKNYVERTVLQAIRNNIAIYAIHTNLDNVLTRGVNERIAQRIGLVDLDILAPKKNLEKLVVYAPVH